MSVFQGRRTASPPSVDAPAAEKPAGHHAVRTGMLSFMLLALALIAGLLLVPLGLPGLWIMLGATFAYWLAVPGGSIGLITLVVVATMVIVAEVLEFTVAGRYARRYGGSRRASWGAIVGSIVGAIVGVPVLVVGSLAGAFAGAFLGALLAEFTVPRERRGAPMQVAKGALIGRAVAAALKVGFGAAILVWVAAAAGATALW